MSPQTANNSTTRAILIGFAFVLAFCVTGWAASEKVLYSSESTSTIQQ